MPVTCPLNPSKGATEPAAPRKHAHTHATWAGHVITCALSGSIHASLQRPACSVCRRIESAGYATPIHAVLWWFLNSCPTHVAPRRSGRQQPSCQAKLWKRPKGARGGERSKAPLSTPNTRQTLHLHAHAAGTRGHRTRRHGNIGTRGHRDTRGAACCAPPCHATAVPSVPVSTCPCHRAPRPHVPAIKTRDLVPPSS